MHHIVIPGLYLLAGIMVYAAVYHFASAISLQRDYVQMLFAAMCLLVVPHALFHGEMLQSPDVTAFARALKWDLATILLLLILLPWFVVMSSEERHLPLPVGLSFLFVVLFFVNLARPFSLQYDHIDRLRTIRLPWDETIIHGVGHISQWVYIVFACVYATLGYAFYAYGKSYRLRHRGSDLAMIVAFGVVLLSSIIGLFTRVSAIDFVEPGPLSFLIVVIVMSTALTYETRQRLRNSEQRFRALVEQSPIAISFSRDGITVDVNDTFLKMFGYDDRAEVIGTSVLDRVAPQDRVEVDDRIRRRDQGLPTETTYEVSGLRKNGSEFPMFVSTKRMELGNEAISSAFLIDFTERKEAEEKIDHLAFYDHLTDLPNRRLFLDRLHLAQASSARSERQYALLLIDLDNFKTLNDTLGHEAGDLLLQQVAKRLVSCVHEGDTVARLGGDEFIVMLVDLSGHVLEAAAQTEDAGENILAALSRPYALAGQQLHTTTSIGATLFSGHRQTTEDLLKQADIAMYQAKHAGRNTLRFFDPETQDTINARVDLEAELRKALQNQQFQLHYQIQVDSSGRRLGAEALIRWIHPERGQMPPGKFIPLAEETGLILPVGEWVLETACAQLKAWQQNAHTHDFVLSVNVSPKRFHLAAFSAEVRSALERHGVDPQLLKLELTESMLLEDIEDTITTMNELKAIGVRLSLDDFGTGYSSLQYLKKLPLDQLKIDQSFVRDIVSDNNDKAIVRTIISMAASLNLDVIAEGVETEQQRQELLAKGCTQYQGYLFGRPVPIEQFEAMLV